MFANGELARLAERKALLLAQSRQNREQLILDCARLQPAYGDSTQPRVGDRLEVEPQGHTEAHVNSY